MKRVVYVIGLWAVLSQSVFGQPVVGPSASYALANFNWGVDAPVFDWSGQLLEGSEWRVELYGGATADSLSPVVSLNGSREIIGLQRPGYFFSPKSFLGVPTVPPYGTAWLQVKVWDAQLGASYEEAVGLGLGGYGQSALFQAPGGNSHDWEALPAPLAGLTSFSVLQVIPEPSSWALFVVGSLLGLGSILAGESRSGRILDDVTSPCPKRPAARRDQ